MLRIHEVTSSSDAKRYYIASDYYTEGQEVTGQFGGKLAHQLGLQGTVDKASFDALCDNLNPKTGKALTPRTNHYRRVGYDLTFSGPKSFSIAEALAPDEERKLLRAAFDDSVMETLAEEIEPDMQCRVRKGGADHDRKTGNILYAYFDHSTSRPVENNPPDPHRHKHVLAFSATYDPVEKRIKAGQFGDIKRDGAYYQAVFFSKLAAKLDKLGYVIERRAGGSFEIAGILPSMIQKFSKRTEEVEEAAAEQGITNEAQKAKLGAKTRSKKQKELTPAQLREKWGEQLTPEERAALERVYAKETAPVQPVTAAEATEFAIAHASEQHSVVPLRELQRLALLHGLGSLLPHQLGEEFKQQGVIEREFSGRRMATTKSLLAEEQFIIGCAAKGLGSVRPIGVPKGLTRGKLNNGQWKAVTGILASENRFNVVIGPAGAGKTTMLKKLDEGLKAVGEDVTYLGTTTDAAEVLATEKFRANTLARFLVDEKLQAEAAGGHIVLDESSLLGHRDAYRLFALADKLDLRITLVGDPAQHGSVNRGATMRVLIEHGGITPFRLSEILRQEDEQYRHAATLLSEGKTVDGFDAIDKKGWVKEIISAEERYRSIAGENLQSIRDKASCLIVSPTHAEASKITQEIRNLLRENGLIKGEDRSFVRLVSRNCSEAERGLATTYQAGDVIQYHQNAKGHTKGDRMTITDPASVPLCDAGKFQLYRQEAIKLAVGDKVRFTAHVKTLDGKHSLANGAVHTVNGFTKAGDITLNNGWVVSREIGHFRPGFVETSFSAQGKTMKRAILAISSDSLAATNMEAMYVSSTRAKEKMSLYTDDKAAVRSSIVKSSQKLAAVDLCPPPQPKADPWKALKPYMERKRRLSIIRRMRAAWDRVRTQPNRQKHNHPHALSTEKDYGNGR